MESLGEHQRELQALREELIDAVAIAVAGEIPDVLHEHAEHPLFGHLQHHQRRSGRPALACPARSPDDGAGDQVGIASSASVGAGINSNATTNEVCA